MCRYLSLLFFCALPFIVKASLVEASTYGYDPVDATSAFQAAINSEFDTIVVDLQAADWNVGPSNFFNVQNKTIIFADGVVLKARAGAFSDPNDCLVRFVNGDNVTLIGYQAIFAMNKAEYAALNDSEYRHCLSLFNCRNITILGITFRDSGGDGIYIGGENNGGGAGYCENILVEDAKCINNYRQGMSVASVENLMVRHCLFTETQGTLPEAGLDIEPYETYQRVVNANFEYCSFTNNGWSGIAVALFEMDGTSPDVSITFSDCYLKDNRLPSNTYAFSEIHLSADPVSPVQGSVVFERCLIDGSEWSALYSRKTADAFAAIFRDCAFRDVSRQQVQYNEPIFLEVPDYDNASDYLGGYVFDNVLVTYETDFSFFRVFGANTLAGLRDVTGSFTVVEPNNNAPLYTDVPDFDNVTYSYTNQIALPATTVAISLASAEAVECDGTPAEFVVTRSSTDLAYPLPVSYSIGGNVSYGDDVHLMTTGLVIPTDETTQIGTIEARADGITEPEEQAQLTLNASELYSVGAAGITATVTDCGTILPVTYLENLRVRPQGEGVLLEWSTAQEQNNDHFKVQKRSETGSFLDIGRVAARNTYATTNYQFYDPAPFAGTNYYRLRQVDRDGSFTFSRTVAIFFEQNIDVFPNPTRGIVQLQAQEGVFTNVDVFNVWGQRVSASFNLNRQQLDLSNLPAGIYWLTLYSTRQKAYTERIVKW